jgi:hypothetical protein
MLSVPSDLTVILREIILRGHIAFLPIRIYERVNCSTYNNLGCQKAETSKEIPARSLPCRFHR